MAKKRIPYCQLPTSMSVTGRSSSITNAFVNAIIPVIEPTEEEELEALEILGMRPDSIRCAYCGDACTEWDHLRPLIRDQKPTGYVTEIANLVPACGKCNQSKGKAHWKDWMLGKARLSPKTRGVPDLENRISRLEGYENWRKPKCINFEAVVGTEMWGRHRQNWQDVLDLMRKSQELAMEIRAIVARSH
jgi:5-methylcytosine-specific restriction endonuclease McrA